MTHKALRSLSPLPAALLALAAALSFPNQAFAQETGRWSLAIHGGAGTLDPDNIHTPGIFVDRIVEGVHEKRIEQRTTRKLEGAA